MVFEYTLQSGSEVRISPHWKFIRWNLKYLENLNAYDDEEYIAIFTR
ncbi:MAG: hypothetical protein PHQ81_05925 [Methanofollis sp.]|nr:hypothetical protein [Methanofollis sp.]